MKSPWLFLIAFFIACGCSPGRQPIIVNGETVFLESMPGRDLDTNSMRIEGDIKKQELEEILEAISHIPKIELKVGLVRKDKEHVEAHLPLHKVSFETNSTRVIEFVSKLKVDRTL